MKALTVITGDMFTSKTYIARALELNDKTFVFDGEFESGIKFSDYCDNIIRHATEKYDNIVIVSQELTSENFNTSYFDLVFDIKTSRAK